MHALRRMTAVLFTCLATVSCSNGSEGIDQKEKWDDQTDSGMPIRHIQAVREFPAGNLSAAKPSVMAPALAITPSFFAFLPPRQYRPVYQQSYVDYEAVAIGDVTGDGREDLIAKPTVNRIEVFVQEMDGTLADPIYFEYGSDNFRSSNEFVLADFNEDGVLDVAFSSFGVYEGGGSTFSQITMLLSNGQGGLTSKNVFTHYENANFRHWVVMDANDDAHLDIVAAQNVSDYSFGAECGANQYTCPRYTVLYGDGAGSLVRRETYQLARPHTLTQLVAQDVNDDGRQDLVMTLGGGNGHVTDARGIVVVAHALPGGGLSSAVPLHEGQISLGGSLIFADVNGDGVDDSIMTHGSQFYGPEVRIRSLSNVFQSPLGIASYRLLPSLTLAKDFDGDRKKDLIMMQLRPAGTGYESVIGYYQQRNDSLQAPVFTVMGFVHVSHHLRAFTAGDLNGDGCTDLVVAGTYDGLFFLDGSQCVSIPRIVADDTGLVWRR